MAFSLDPYSPRTGVEYAMDRMQKEMEYRFQQMQRNTQMQYQPMYQAVEVNGETQVYKNGVKQEETKEQKTAKERASKLRNLIAYYYSR